MLNKIQNIQCNQKMQNIQLYIVMYKRLIIFFFINTRIKRLFLLDFMLVTIFLVFHSRIPTAVLHVYCTLYWNAVHSDITVLHIQ